MSNNIGGKVAVITGASNGLLGLCAQGLRPTKIPRPPIAATEMR